MFGSVAGRNPLDALLNALGNAKVLRPRVKNFKKALKNKGISLSAFFKHDDQGRRHVLKVRQTKLQQAQRLLSDANDDVQKAGDKLAACKEKIEELRQEFAVLVPVVTVAPLILFPHCHLLCVAILLHSKGPNQGTDGTRSEIQS